MRLEGAIASTASTAQKSMPGKRIMRRGVAPHRKCTVDYICPPDWCHAFCDVASASELPAAANLPLRSVTMSEPVAFQRPVIDAAACPVCCGVR
jgi:hypothetical protein